MIDTAKKDVSIGSKMLLDCALAYDECHSDAADRVDVALAKVVLTYENMKNSGTNIVDSCLMELPAQYLEFAECKEEHGDLSNITIRLKYVQFQVKTMSEEEKCDILRHCNLGGLNSEELKELYKLGMFNHFAFVEQCHEETIKERDEDRKRIDALEKKMEMLEMRKRGKCLFISIIHWK